MHPRRFIDLFYEIPTLVMVCDVVDPITRQNYNRDPRWIARKSGVVPEEQRYRRHGILRRRSGILHFDNVRFDQNQHSGFYFIDAKRAAGTPAARETTLGYPPAL